MDCKGHKCVVGWDRVARVVPMDDDELRQARKDADEHAAAMAERAKGSTKDERFAEMLAVHGLTLDDLREIMARK